MDNVEGRLRVSRVARELRHGLAGMGVDVLLNRVGDREVALDHVFGIRDAALWDREALGELDRLATHGACDLELVVAKRGRRRLEAGAHVDRRVEADRDGDRHVAACLLVFLEEGAEMARSGGDPHAEGRRILNAEAVDRDIGGAILRVGAHRKAHRDVGAGILRGVRRGRDELAQIEARIRRLVDDLLAVDVLALLDHDRRDGLVQLLAHLDAEMLAVHANEACDTLAACEHADYDASIVEALHPVEEHDGAFLGRTHDRSACSDIAVDAGDLGVRIDFRIGLEELARLGPEICKRAAKIVDLFHLCPPGSCQSPSLASVQGKGTKVQQVASQTKTGRNPEISARMAAFREQTASRARAGARIRGGIIRNPYLEPAEILMMLIGIEGAVKQAPIDDLPCRHKAAPIHPRKEL